MKTVLAVLLGFCLISAVYAGVERDLSLYIGGEQTPSSGPAGKHITTYHFENGDWGSFAWGCNGAVRVIKVIEGFAYIAGDFLECNNQFVGPMAKYDLTTGVYSSVLPSEASWQYAWDVTLDATVNSTTRGNWAAPSIVNWQFYKGNFYVVGLFAIDIELGYVNPLDNSTVTRINNVGVYNPRTNQWRQLGQGLNARVSSLWVQDENTIFFGGRFDRSGYGATYVPAFDPPGFVVYHEGHQVYGTGYMQYTIPFSSNKINGGFSLNGEVLSIWRGVIQREPSGERLNPPIGTPEPSRLTLILGGDFDGGVIFQQDSMPWEYADGGLWGGPVRRIVPDLDNNCIYFAGGFTQTGSAMYVTPDFAVVDLPGTNMSVGGFARWNYQNQIPRGGDWYNPLATSNSIPQPKWDSLEGGVSKTAATADVYDMSFEEVEGLIFLVGDFDLVGEESIQNIVSFDLNQRTYSPVGEGNEFSATLYAVTMGVYQSFWNNWEGAWTDHWHNGMLTCCTVERSIQCTNDVEVFEGTISADGSRASGNWMAAGNTQDGNRGKFALTMNNDNMGFSGWYTVDGENGRNSWNEAMIKSYRPDAMQCNQVDYAEGETLVGQWQLGVTTLLNICVTKGQVYASTNRERYYSGITGKGDKTIQAQWYDATGFGVSIFRQIDQDTAVENWFSGELRDLDITADCIEASTCGVGILWTRRVAVLSDEACRSEESRAYWEGGWFLGRLHNMLWLRQEGNGLIHGGYGVGIIEGEVVPDSNGNCIQGKWIEGGWDELDGVLRGSFNVCFDPRSDRRVFEGSLLIDHDIDGNVIVDKNGDPAPIHVRWASERYSYDVPSAKNAMMVTTSPQATFAGSWKRDDGEVLSLCVVTSHQTNEPEVRGSVSGRFYAGDKYVISATEIDQESGRNFATLTWWEENGTGFSIIRRVTDDMIQEHWAAGDPIRFDRALCTAETCQFADAGNAVLYQYIGQPIRPQCDANEEFFVQPTLV